jgi:hypothetical protein
MPHSAGTSGELATLVSWIDALPGQIWRAPPQPARFARALSQRPAISAQFLDHAEAGLHQSSLPEPEANELRALTAVYRAAIAAFRGDRLTAWLAEMKF